MAATKEAKGASASAWLLPPAYEIVSNREEFGDLDSSDERLDDPATVAEYGKEIVDEVAVGIMVRGDRRVASTLLERRIAARIMIEQLHLEPQEVAERLGTLVVKLPEVIGPLGWEVLPRTDGTGKRVRPTARFQRVGSRPAAKQAGGRA